MVVTQENVMLLKRMRKISMYQLTSSLENVQIEKLMELIKFIFPNCIFLKTKIKQNKKLWYPVAVSQFWALIKEIRENKEVPQRIAVSHQV